MLLGSSLHYAIWLDMWWCVFLWCQVRYDSNWPMWIDSGKNLFSIVLKNALLCWCFSGKSIWNSPLLLGCPWNPLAVVGRTQCLRWQAFSTKLVNITSDKELMDLNFCSIWTPVQFPCRPLKAMRMRAAGWRTWKLARVFELVLTSLERIPCQMIHLEYLSTFS